jgi:hypothetical protein
MEDVSGVIECYEISRTLSGIMSGDDRVIEGGPGTYPEPEYIRITCKERIKAYIMHRFYVIKAAFKVIC